MKTIRTIVLTSAMAAFLAACGGGISAPPVAVAPPPPPAPEPEPEPVMRVFEVSVVNLTAGQPFSPIAVVSHEAGYSAFDIGQPASEGLEILAEGGDNATFIEEAQADETVLMTVSGDGPLGPGATGSFMLELEDSVAASAYVSAVTMLVNTNDAITGLRSVEIGSLEVGDRRQMTTISYDAGTELNSELAGTIPGPADGGEGLNTDRDDLDDIVRVHSGVLTVDDGLAESVLTEVHRWDNPVARVTVSRVE